MEVHIDKLLEQKNKTRYWLSQQIGVSYACIMQLCNNKTMKIEFRVADKICKALECELEDWLKIEK